MQPQLVSSLRGLANGYQHHHHMVAVSEIFNGSKTVYTGAARHRPRRHIAEWLVMTNSI